MYTKKWFVLCMATHQAFAGNSPSTECSPEERVLRLSSSIGRQEDTPCKIARLKYKEAFKTQCQKPVSNRVQQQKALALCVSGVPREHSGRLENLFEGLSLKSNPEKIVNAIDGRQKVTTTQDFPWSAQCLLTLSFTNATYTGSGTLIGPNLVLTAAHNLYDRTTKERASSVKVIPGFNAGNCPFGVPPTVEAWYYPDAYVTHGDEDYALIVLQDKIAEATGHMGLWHAPVDVLKNITLSVTGYPGDKRCDNGGQLGLYTMSGKAAYVDKDHLAYTIDTYPGQSGSGVYCEEAGDFFVVGIHIQGSTYVNTATLLTQERLEMIQNWTQDYTKKALRQMEKTLFSSDIFSAQFGEKTSLQTWEGFSFLIEMDCFAHVSRLFLSGINIDNINAFSHLRNLKVLHITNAHIQSLQALQYCTKIEDLNLSHNDIVHLDGLEDLTDLDVVNLSHNKIVNLKPLSGLIGISRLDLSHNHIVDIRPLKNLNNGPASIGVFKKPRNLWSLDLKNNRIQDITDNDVKTILRSVNYFNIDNNCFLKTNAAWDAALDDPQFITFNQLLFARVFT